MGSFFQKRSADDPYWKTFDFTNIPGPHAEILQLVLAGYTKESVAQEVGCTARTVFRVASLYGLRSPRSGRPMGSYPRKAKVQS